jgi:hypothetical protein
MKLFIYVEGQEEEMFVNRLLRGYLNPYGIIVQRPVLAATSFRLSDGDEIEITVGGVTNYNSIRNDILNQFAAEQISIGDALTTFVDLYALPTDFPGYGDALAQKLAGAQKASFIEKAWKVDIGRPNFFPYIQVHEFEALVLTQPSVLNKYYPEHAASIETLRKECEQFRSPEDINEAKSTSPSHRILSRLPTYQKIDGFRHLQDIGLPALKAHCPRFKIWLEQCERFFK